MTRENYLKNLIRSEGYTLKGFASTIGIPYSTLLSMLNNSIGGAAVDNVIKICAALGITVEQLQNVKSYNYYEQPNNKMRRDLNMLGDKLKQLRKQKGISQEELANALHINRGTYAHYEINKRQPDFAILKKLSEFFGVSLDFMLDNLPADVEQLQKEVINKEGTPEQIERARIGGPGNSISAIYKEIRERSVKNAGLES